MTHPNPRTLSVNVIRQLFAFDANLDLAHLLEQFVALFWRPPRYFRRKDTDFASPLPVDALGPVLLVIAVQAATGPVHGFIQALPARGVTLGRGSVRRIATHVDTQRAARLHGQFLVRLAFHRSLKVLGSDYVHRTTRWLIDHTKLTTRIRLPIVAVFAAPSSFGHHLGIVRGRE